MSKYIYGSLVGLSVLGMALSGPPAAQSPPADTDLICPSENTADCYPRIFQPTEDFQFVREGQDLPPGLHVRLNVWTGEKEARLNIPIEEDTILEGLPTERSIVTVDQPDQLEQPLGAVTGDKPAMRDQLSRKPPVYEGAGKIIPPRDPNGSGGDSEDFLRAVNVLESKNLHDDAVDSALSDLSDLAHDIFYGVELVKRGDTLKKLITLMSSNLDSQRRQAASILGGCIQNNPTALKQARATWKALLQDKTLVQKIQQALEQETNPNVARAKISALVGLTKDADARDSFLENRGMDLLLSIFLKEGEQWDATRRRIAQFVMDTFLDQDMGAKLGVWPTQKQDDADSTRCREPEQAAKDVCWQYHLEKMEADAGNEGHEWLAEFLKLLRSSKGAAGNMGNKDRDREL